MDEFFKEVNAFTCDYIQFLIHTRARSVMTALSLAIVGDLRWNPTSEHVVETGGEV